MLRKNVYLTYYIKSVRKTTTVKEHEPDRNFSTLQQTTFFGQTRLIFSIICHFQIMFPLLKITRITKKNTSKVGKYK
ncbi:hypothetical protein ATZ33_07850 [Enterococcus silesiacus]|uniref:Uncharacterized protein n=1 Tax=Enterococcus silesiacus TaxID=332949 RepID=A0ABN4J5W0_9ENTE|nr:hypothetical protein ATZ33_07850 [Enterococcus silesiacus]